MNDQRRQLGPAGRDTEIERTLEVITGGGPGRVVIVRGVAGVGKTTFLHAIVDRLRPHVHVEWLTGSPGDVRFGAVSHLLPVEIEDPTTLLSTIRHRLSDRAGTEAGVIVFDDVHLADPATLTVLHQMVAHREATLLASARSDHSVPDMLATHPDVSWMRLGPLDRPSFDDLVSGLLGGSASDGLTDSLWDLTDGLPLFAEIATSVGLMRQDIVCEDGRWQLVGSLRSGRLTDAVARRMTGLDPTARSVMIASRLVTTLPRAIATSLVTTAQLADLVDAGLLHESSAGVEIAHGLFGDVVVGDREEVVAVARRLAGEEWTGLRALRVASVLHEAGCVVPSGLAAEAATDALRRGEMAVAEEIAASAFRSVPSEMLAMLAARGAAAAGAPDRAMDHLDRIETTDPEMVLEAHLLRASLLAFAKGQPAAGAAVLDRFLDDLPDGSRHLVAAEQSLYRAMAGDFQAVLASSARALADPGATDRVRAAVSVNRVLALAMIGDVDELDHILGEARALAVSERSALPLASLQIELADVVGRVAAGQVHEAAAGIDRFRATASDGGWGDGPLCAQAAFVAMVQGRVSEAVAMAQRALDRSANTDPFRLRNQHRALLAWCRAERDFHTGVVDREMEALAAEVGEETRLRVWVDRAVVWQSAPDDPIGMARIAADRGAVAIAADHVVWGALLAHDAVRLGSPELAADSLDTAAERAHGALFLDALAERAHAVHDRDGMALRRLAPRFEAMGADQLALECWIGAADASRGGFDDVSSRRDGARIALLRHRGVDSPVTAVSEMPEGVSPAEFVVLPSALEGLTSREIADRTYLSVRTVDNHLRSIYRKLGISGREELAAVLGPPGAARR